MVPRTTEGSSADVALPQSISEFSVGDVLVLSTEESEYTFVVSDPDKPSGTLVGGSLDVPTPASLVGAFREDLSDFEPRELRTSATALFAVTMGGGALHCLYRATGVIAIRRVSRSGPAPALRGS